jgi:hypothetical protein
MLLQQFSANPPLVVKRVPGAMRISYGAVLPLPPEEAFAFVADPVNWPLFVPSVRSCTRTTTGVKQAAMPTSPALFSADP